MVFIEFDEDFHSYDEIEIGSFFFYDGRLFYKTNHYIEEVKQYLAIEVRTGDSEFIDDGASCDQVAHATITLQI